MLHTELKPLSPRDPAVLCRFFLCLSLRPAACRESVISWLRQEKNGLGGQHTHTRHFHPSAELPVIGAIPDRPTEGLCPVMRHSSPPFRFSELRLQRSWGNETGTRATCCVGDIQATNATRPHEAPVHWFGWGTGFKRPDAWARSVSKNPVAETLFI